MNIKIIILSLLSFVLMACGRSKPSQYYVLNPIATSVKTTNHFNGLKIGIDSLSVPAYLNKIQIPLFQTPNQAKLLESHEWAEELEKNTRRVLETNLTVLLPGSLVVSSPWEAKFVPNYTIQVVINQWSVMATGLSRLQAKYIIFNESGPLYQKTVSYYKQIPNVIPESLVLSMNSNLTHLSEDIAQSIRLVRGKHLIKP